MRTTGAKPPDDRTLIMPPLTLQDIPKSLTLSVLEIALFLAPNFWLMNGDTITSAPSATLTQLFKTLTVYPTPINLVSSPPVPSPIDSPANTPKRLT